MRLTLAFCSAKPNWMPRKPKHMFQICQNESVGLAVGVAVIAGFSSWELRVAARS